MRSKRESYAIIKVPTGLNGVNQHKRTVSLQAHHWRYGCFTVRSWWCIYSCGREIDKLRMSEKEKGRELEKRNWYIVVIQVELASVNVNYVSKATMFALRAWQSTSTYLFKIMVNIPWQPIINTNSKLYIYIIFAINFNLASFKLNF